MSANTMVVIWYGVSRRRAPIPLHDPRLQPLSGCAGEPAIRRDQHTPERLGQGRVCGIEGRQSLLTHQFGSTHHQFAGWRHERQPDIKERSHRFGQIGRGSGCAC